MSSFIKTGASILVDGINDFQVRQEQWVSLSWLKEQIETKHKDFFHTKIKPTFYDGLDWVLSLLSQEEKH